ncbi:AMP-binding protein [Pseudomonas sp. RGM2987]|uniref:class I adenylate-forming enzyme family protein n=1 Tax=Pseudomonas sp. RGM2987 TaxID=2930090 RepID=UPI001FD7125C|nr:AMP-binding protein [Pseudomonas sp. RGM2987]MCJ8207519.1 AMP-binding protein [Pseudomonas sp. RGM2987]
MINPHQVNAINLKSLLRRGTLSAHDKPLLAALEGPSMSGTEVYDHVLHLSAALSAAGVRAGNSVALLGSSFVENALLYWALTRLNALPVLGSSEKPPIDPLQSHWQVGGFAHEQPGKALDIQSLFGFRLTDHDLEQEKNRSVNEGEGEDEDAVIAWTAVALPNTGRQYGGGRTHRQITYTGFFGTFAIHTDRTQRIAVIGSLSPALFEILLFIGLAGGVEIYHIEEERFRNSRTEPDLRSFDTLVVAPKHVEAVFYTFSRLWSGKSKVTVILSIDAAEALPSVIPVWSAKANALGIIIRPLLLSALDGIVAEYSSDRDLWHGFPGVDIAVVSTSGIEQSSGADGVLAARSPQISVDRFGVDESCGFYADGWSRLPTKVVMHSDGFSFAREGGVDLGTVIESVTTKLKVLEKNQLDWVSEIDVTELIRRSARWRPEQLAIDTDGRKISYADLVTRVEQLAKIFSHSLDVGVGDRVAVIGRNSVEFVISYLAANSLGAICVPINFRLMAKEIAFVLDDSGAKLLLHNRDLGDVVGQVGTLVRGPVRFAEFDPLTTVASASGVQVDNLPPAPRIVPDERRPASILYTAGTTGFPKGAVRTNRNVLWFSFLGMASEFRTRRLGSFLITTPMFHITGHEPAIFGALTTGGSSLVRSEFKVDTVLDLLIEHRIAGQFIPPTIGVDLLDRIEQRGSAGQLHSFRYWSSASAPLPGVLLDRIHKVLPWVKVSNTLGMTEAGSIARHEVGQDDKYAQHAPGCVGRAELGGEICIVDAHDGRLARMGRGEIVVRSPQVISAYWNNPSASEVTLKKGWLHGGDIGEFDAHGNIEIKGRVKDMIITGGENVYAVEVENVLLGFPEVKEAAVYGRSDERWGESVNAALVLRSGSALSEAEVISRCRSLIAHYKSPRRVIFLNALPRNPIGKVMKFAIVEAETAIN